MGNLFQKAQKDPAAALRERAKLSPAYEAYRSPVSRFFSLHVWLLSSKRSELQRTRLAAVRARWLTSLTLILLGVGLLVASLFADDINRSHVHYCCYPEGIPRTLGSCADADSAIRARGGLRECTSVNFLYPLFIGLGLFFVVVNYFFVQFEEGNFIVAAAEDVEVMEKNAKEMPEDEFVRTISQSHDRLYLAAYLPDTFLFGLNQRLVGGRLQEWAYVFMLWGGALAAVLFFAVAEPLDAAWRCYPSATIYSTNLGRCDHPSSKAARRYHTRSDNHLLLWWATLVSWVVLHVGALLFYGYTLYNFKSEYARMLWKRAQRGKKKK
jgi:hypothetical protein